MSLESRRELLQAQRGRYGQAERLLKGQMLEELGAASGERGEYGTRVVNQPPKKRTRVEAPRYRKRTYTTDTQRALVELWQLGGGVCGKRLVALIPDLLDALERFDEIEFSDATKEQLRRISASTIDRLLC